MVKMLYCSGFEHVYEYIGKIDHDDFIESDDRYKRRGIILASRRDIYLKDFKLCLIPKTPKYNFSKIK